MKPKVYLIAILAIAVSLILPNFASAKISPVVGQRVTTATGNWKNSPTFTFKWEDCDVTGSNCSLIPGATSQSYVVSTLDIGHTLRAVIIGTNKQGTASRESLPTGVVTAAPISSALPTNTVLPAVSGAFSQGQTASSTTGTWTISGTPTTCGTGGMTCTYQWEDCDARTSCTDISGATSSTYTLTAADTDLFVRVRVTAAVTGGSTAVESAVSSSTILASSGSGGTWTGSQESGSPNTACNYYVSTSGSNTNSGTASDNSHAWQTADYLFAHLPTGNIGCFESGIYGTGSNDQELLFTPNVTITAAPGAVAVIKGQPYFEYQATGSTLSYLNVDLDFQVPSGNEPLAICSGTTYSAAGVELNGNNQSLLHDNLYQTDVPAADRGDISGVGFSVNPSTHTATGDIIAYNRMHDYGNTCGHGHAIYSANSDHAAYYDNWIYNNPTGAAGIQFYDSHLGLFLGPHDDQAYANVFDAINVGALLFGETSSYANISLNHNIFHNVGSVYGTTEQHQIRSAFQANSGIVNNSISFTNNDGTSIIGTWPCNPDDCGSRYPVIQFGNITSDPRFADASYASLHDYRVSSSSPAVSWGMWDGDIGGSQTSLIGSSVVSTTTSIQDSDDKRANCYSAGSTGAISSILIYLLPTGNTGSQNIQAGLYSSSAGAPNVLLSSSGSITFTNLSPSGWYSFPITPVSVSSGTTYCLAYLTGGTPGILAVKDDPGGTIYYNANPYSGGFSNPWGTISTGTQKRSMFAYIKP